MSVWQASSLKLQKCLIELEIPEKKSEAKMELMMLTSELAPAGKPDFASVIRYPKISELISSEGKRKVLAFVTIIVRDFCASINVVRNMNEDQVIESAMMLVEECEDFRLEDYVMMFSMAKKGSLDVKIFDRIDIQVITQILDAYWLIRKRAGDRLQQEEIQHIDSLGPTGRLVDNMNSGYVKLLNATDGLAGAIGSLKNHYSEWKNEANGEAMDNG